MSNNTSLIQTSPIHLFFSPSRPVADNFRARENNFLLDCVNPKTSKLPTYHPQEDHYNKSYLSTVLQRVKTSKENRSPRPSNSKSNQPQTKSQPGISGEDFRKYLMEKMHTVTQTNLNSENS